MRTGLSLAMGILWIAAFPMAPCAQQEPDPELQEMLGTPQTPAPGSAGRARGSTVSGLSNAFNPAISVNGLLLGTGSDEGPAEFGPQEFELQFSSDIDPYFRADITLSVHEEFDVPSLAHGHEEADAATSAEEEAAVGLEQALITSTRLPSVTLRFGKFWLPFGKHNILHTHQFPFITAPVVNQETFGEEPLIEMAMDATPLLPLPFFSELNLVAFQGDNEPLFHFAAESGGPDQAKYLVHSKNLFDLTDESTLELGLSYLSGTIDAGGGALTTVYGADLTFKQRPQIGRGLGGLTLQAEYIAATREAAHDLESSGYFVSAQWRVFDYWWVQGRHGAVAIDEAEQDAIEEEESRHTDFLIAWVPTEFSALRLQYSLLELGEEKVSAWYLQYNFAIGSHPAHQY